MKPATILYASPGVIGLILIIINFFTNDITVDIHIHNTYFIIANYFAIIGLLLLFLWLLIALTKSLVWQKSLSRIHILLSVLILIFWASLPLWYNSLWNHSRSPYTYTDFYRFRRFEGLMSVSLLIFLLAQVIFIFNLIAGLVRRLIRQSKV